MPAEAKAFSRWLAEKRRKRRSQLLERTARGKLRLDLVLRRVDAVHWIDSLGYDLLPAAHHFGRARSLGIRTPAGGGV